MSAKTRRPDTMHGSGALDHQFAEFAWWTLCPKQSRHDLVAAVLDPLAQQILRGSLVVPTEFDVAVCDRD